MPQSNTVTISIASTEHEENIYLLGNPPSWMLHYGISVVAFGVMILFALAYFVQYPDVVETKVVLTTANPPIRIKAKTSAKVSELLVKDQTTIREGQVLAVLESTTNYQDVLLLENAIKAFSSSDTKELILPERLNLGSLQTAFSTFVKHLKDYQYFNQNKGVPTKTSHFEGQIKELQTLNSNLNRQKTIFENEVILSARNLTRQKELYSQGIIALSELEKSVAAHLSQKRQLEGTEANRINNEMQIRQLKSQISDLHLTQKDSENSKTLALDQDLEQLKSSVAAWKESYLITAPIAGQVSMSKIWSNQQAIGVGEEILSVVPTTQQQNKVFGKATLPIGTATKIKTGMRSIVRLDGLPYLTFGTIEGQLTNISLVPEKEDYLLEVTFSTQPLVSSYNNTVPFRQEMSGQLRIITEQKNVLERLLQ
jgi:multidrug resistance efflux pump